jgi:hypothetical protein
MGCRRMTAGRAQRRPRGFPVGLWRPKFDEIFHLAPSTESPVSVVQALANMVVELAHQDGSSVRALMSRSALIRSDDDIALATFQDLTEQLWLDER